MYVALLRNVKIECILCIMYVALLRNVKIENILCIMYVALLRNVNLLMPHIVHFTVYKKCT